MSPHQIFSYRMVPLHEVMPRESSVHGPTIAAISKCLLSSTTWPLHAASLPGFSLRYARCCFLPCYTYIYAVLQRLGIFTPEMPSPLHFVFFVLNLQSHYVLILRRICIQTAFLELLISPTGAFLYT